MDMGLLGGSGCVGLVVCGGMVVAAARLTWS